MRALRKVLVLVLVAAASSVGCHRNRCVEVCEQRAKELGCHPQDPCKKTCEALHKMPTCPKELGAFESCFLSRPLADWECDLGDGTPVVHATVCSPEREAVTACLQQPGAQPPH